MYDFSQSTVSVHTSILPRRYFCLSHKGKDVRKRNSKEAVSTRSKNHLEADFSRSRRRQKQSQ